MLSPAYGITFLKGKGGLNGWQWIFTLEGVATVVLGIFTWLFVADFPDKARFLAEDERKVRISISTRRQHSETRVADDS